MEAVCILGILAHTALNVSITWCSTRLCPDIAACSFSKSFRSISHWWPRGGRNRWLNHTLPRITFQRVKAYFLSERTLTSCWKWGCVVHKCLLLTSNFWDVLGLKGPVCNRPKPCPNDGLLS